MPVVRSIAMKSIRTTILTSYRNRREAPWVPRFQKFLLFILQNFLLNQNDVEFDLNIGHALVLFQFFRIINKKCTVEFVHPPSRTLRNLYILIYFRHKTLFSPNLMIIIFGYFRNTSNCSK